MCFICSNAGAFMTSAVETYLLFISTIVKQLHVAEKINRRNAVSSAWHSHFIMRFISFLTWNRQGILVANSTQERKMLVQKGIKNIQGKRVGYVWCDHLFRFVFLLSLAIFQNKKLPSCEPVWVSEVGWRLWIVVVYCENVLAWALQATGVVSGLHCHSCSSFAGHLINKEWNSDKCSSFDFLTETQDGVFDRTFLLERIHQSNLSTIWVNSAPGLMIALN